MVRSKRSTGAFRADKPAPLTKRGGEGYPQCRPAPRRCGAGARGRATRPRPACWPAPRSARPDRDGDAAHRGGAEGRYPCPAPRHDPRPRTDRLKRLRRHHAGCRGVPDGARLFRLARAHAEAPFQRRQGAVGRISKGEAPNAIRPREGPNNRYLRRLLYLLAPWRRTSQRAPSVQARWRVRGAAAGLGPTGSGRCCRESP